MKNLPIVEIFYSFDNHEQDITKCEFDPEWTLEEFLEFVFEDMKPDMLDDLYKLDCCVYHTERIKGGIPPLWYEMRDGKFYFNPEFNDTADVHWLKGFKDSFVQSMREN